MWRCLRKIKDKINYNNSLFSEVQKEQCNKNNQLISEATKFFKNSLSPGRNSYLFVVQSDNLKSKVCKPASAENDDDFHKRYSYHRLNSNKKCHQFLNALHWVSNSFYLVI
jgi:hypothetical protein